MPSKLKDLKITKVDFVDAGANPEANILLFKNKEGAPAAKPAESSPKGGDKTEGVIKKFFAAIAKALGLGDEQIGQAIEEIAKGYEAATFDEKMDEQKRRRVTSEIWDVCYALVESLCSIFCDDEVAEEDKSGLMEQSLNEFSEAVKAKLDAIMAKADEPVDEGCKPKKPKTTKGASEDMKIDKSKLTPEELTTSAAGQQPAGEGEDIYKGLHPAIRAELESLRKTANALEDRELTEVAKKYEIIGKKPEELVPLFKSLKAAGGEAYNQMITILDASVAAVEKSGLFSEIGKKGNGATDAWAAIEKYADEIMKSMPTLTRAQAIDKACEQHPELVHEYENKR